MLSPVTTEGNHDAGDHRALHRRLERDRPGRRRGLVDSLWAADGSYTDPLADAHGREEIDGLIGAVQGQFPGLVFRLGGPVDANHNQARFSWHLGPPTAASPS